MTPLHSAEKYWKKDIVEFLTMHIDKLKTIKMRKNEAIYYEKKNDKEKDILVILILTPFLIVYKLHTLPIIMVN